MIALRCTRKLAARLKLPAYLPEPLPPTTLLGDWYGNLVYAGRQPVVMLTSERSLLTVLLPARDLDRLPRDFLGAARDLLQGIGATPDQIDAELLQMADITFGHTTNRSVLGSMNELALLGKAWWDDGRMTLPELALRLARVPMSAIGTKSRLEFPDKIARNLLAPYGRTVIPLRTG